MGTVSLRITGMSCDHCVRAVERALGAFPGVSARVSLEEGTARVDTETEIDVEKLVRAVEAEGYGAAPAEGEA